MKKNAAAILACALLAPCVTTAATTDRIFSDGFDHGAPVVLYTDIVSGPTSGGENNKGAYLSIFGKNFGNGSLGTSIKVFVVTAKPQIARYHADRFVESH